MITATAWVPRGFAAQFPTKYEFNQEEFDRIAKLAKLQLDEAQEDLEEAEDREGASLPTSIVVSNTKEYAEMPPPPDCYKHELTNLMRLVKLMTT